MPGGEDQFDRLHVLSPEFSGKRKTDRFSPRKLGDNKAPLFLRIPVADSLNELRTTEGQIAYVTGDGADDQGLYFRTETAWTEAGGDPGAPPDASYVVLSSDPNLSNESTHASLTGTDLHDPATHGSTHQDGGADELQVDTLAGDNGSSGQVLQTDGSALSFNDPGGAVQEVATFSDLPAPNPPQLAFTADETEYYHSVGDPANAFDITQATFTTSINTQDSGPRGITFDNTGSRLYEVGVNGDKIYQSDLSTDFDITTASFTTSISTQDGRPQGIAFDNDGSRLYEVGRSDDKIYQSDLSTAFDISTASFTTSISTQDSNATGIAFDNTGSRLYEVGFSGDKIYQSDLSTAFDITTASFTTSINTQDSAPRGITFDNDGSRLYEVGSNGDKIYQSDLSTDFDITTASFTTSINTQDDSPQGIAFDNTGSRLYEIGNVDDKIYQSDIPAPRWTEF